MKKRILATLVSVMMILAVVGCGKKEAALEIEEGASVPQEIVQMVNTDLPSISAERDEAVSIYNKYFQEGAELDSETWRAQLEDEALVKYDAYLVKLEGLMYTNSEVVNLKNLFVKSANSQREAISYVVEAVRDIDTAKLDLAQQSIDDSKTYMSMYEDELKSLCEKYNIEVVGSFGSYDASATDASASDAE